MNTELKKILDLIFDGVITVEDVLSSHYIGLFKDVFSLFGDAGGVISNFDDLRSEIAALDLEINRADIEAYVGQKFELIENEMIRDILNAGLKIVDDLSLLYQDILFLANKTKN